MSALLSRLCLGVICVIFLPSAWSLAQEGGRSPSVTPAAPAQVAPAQAAPAQVTPLKAAVFGFEFSDDSAEGGGRSGEAERLKLANAELVRLLTASGDLVAVDLSPMAQDIARQAPLFKCNGCEPDLARALGAQVSVSGVIRKTSNLILSFTLQVTDVAHGDRRIRAGVVDTRGNTDEDWLRAVRYLVKNRILAADLPPLRAAP